MAKYRKKPVVIEAITFEEFVEYGKKNGGNIVNGMLWSFNYKGHPITHENDECYLVPTSSGVVKFTPQDMLITQIDGEIYPCRKDIFEKTYDKVNEAEKSSKLNMTISVKDTEIFQILLDYTKKLVGILEEYPLSDEHRAQLDEISKEFFKLKREVDL